MNAGFARHGKMTLQSLAEELGVSKTTVSNAYNRPDQISPETRAKVLAKAHALGYSGPHPAARMLRKGKTDTIGILMPEALTFQFVDPASTKLLEGVAAAVGPEGMSMLLVPGIGMRDLPVELVRDAAVDGFILYSLPEGEALTAAALARNLPSVFVEVIAPEDAYSVEIEDETGAALAASHLAELGHRSIAIMCFRIAPDNYVGPADLARQGLVRYPVTRRRFTGYRKGLEAHGVEWPAVWETVDPGGHSSVQLGYQTGRMILETRPRPTAVLVMSDLLAIGLLKAARDLNIAVPEELSIVGYDDVEMAGLEGLTTVRQPLYEKGLWAGRTLLDLIEGIEPEHRRRILPTNLVVRSTTTSAP
ncbi:MAG: LacI family DNA-binding transcriptional regulator [Actinomycetota bacterium]